MFRRKSKIKDLIEETSVNPKNQEAKNELHEMMERFPSSFQQAVEELKGIDDDPIEERTLNILSDQHQLSVAAREGLERFTWCNAIDTIRVQPLKYFTPTSLEELVDIVTYSEQNNLNLKAVAAGHSYSDITKTDDLMINMLGMNNVLKIPTETYNDTVDHSHFFRIQGGATLQIVNEEMDKIGLALPTMPGIDEQTLAGAFATATHGSNPNYGSLSDLIVSLVLVTTGGKIHRIEPSDGITNPVKHSQSDEHLQDKVTLIQDDDWFNTVIVSMGCVGIIYSATIKVVPSFYIKEKKYLSTWAEIRPKLASGELFEGNNHLEVLINPYNKDGRHLAIVMHHEIVEDQKPTRNTRKFDLLTNLVEAIPASQEMLEWYVNTFPEKVPNVVESALEQLEEEQYINKSYKVLHQGLENIKSRGIATEMAFPMDEYLEVIDDLINTINKMARVGNQYMSSPISLRFGTKSRAYLGMSADWDVCMIDLPMLKDTHGRAEMYDTFQEETFYKGGRPHWGKILNRLAGRDLLKKMYPNFEKWEAVYKQLNHKGVFNNEFTDRLGISVYPDFKSGAIRQAT